jgi:NADH-quinone oxidoreductase subunit N
MFENIINIVKYSVYLIPLIIIIMGSIGIENKNKRMTVVIQSLKLTLILIGLLILIEDSNYVKLNGHLIKNELIETFELMLIIVSYVIVIIIEKGINNGSKSKITEETLILMYSSIVGMLISMEAHNLITLFLSLEISSICFYILALNKNSRKMSIEGGLKYYIVGGIASTIILLGIVSIYKSTGSLMYTDILLVVMENEVDSRIKMGLALLVLGLIIKLGIAPFHGWLIDTYEGTGMMMTFFLTITQKIVTITVLINMYMNIITYVSMELMNKALIILIMTTLIVGTVGSLRQQKLIRFIAYSAIVNSGLLIMFFVGNNIEELISYSIYYLINYIIGLTVLITIIMGMKRNITGDNVEILTELRNIWINNKTIGVIIIVVLIYLAGLPPFTNFISKLILILPYIVEGRMYIAMIILFLTVGVMIYYINIVKIILIDKKAYNGLEGKNVIENYKIITGGNIISAGVMWIIFSQLFLDEIISIIKIIVAVSQ